MTKSGTLSSLLQSNFSDDGKYGLLNRVCLEMKEENKEHNSE
jgi:hypothetical protein